MESKNIKVGLVIMASGFGTRFGGNKLMVEMQGKPLIQWGMDASEGVFDRRIVVTRYDTVKQLCDRQGVECVVHDFPGRNDTVRLGLERLKEDVDVVFFLTGDQPLISKDSLIQLAEAAKENSGKIIRSCFENTVGNPVGFPKQTFSELLNLPQGKGGNVVIRNHPELVQLVSVKNEYELWDVDIPEDINRMEKISQFT